MSGRQLDMQVCSQEKGTAGGINLGIISVQMSSNEHDFLRETGSWGRSLISLESHNLEDALRSVLGSPFGCNG